MLQIDIEQVRALPRKQRERLALLLAERKRRQGQRQFYRLFPDEDTIQPDGSLIHARAKYGKHLEFFEAGATYRERLLCAANRVGKTVAGAYETTCHLTGQYPEWWVGRRFTRPIRAWAAGKTNETTRDIVQAALMGSIVEGERRKGFSGTGMIPGSLLGPGTWKQGVSDLCDTVKIKHVTGGWSQLGFKSYQQGRGSFEGTAQHLIWGDEELPMDIYGECLIRTATTHGLLMITVTPLEGLTESVLQFMPQEMRPTA
jgi:phage terminase large subunit-like protein